MVIFSIGSLVVLRFGSNVDVENMKALLVGLEFDATVEKNLHFLRGDHQVLF